MQERYKEPRPPSRYFLETKIRHKGGKLITKAVRQLELGEYQVIPKGKPPGSYFSWPTKESVKRFRENGHRFFTVRDMFEAFFRV